MHLKSLYQLIALLFICKIKGIYSYGKIYTTSDNKQYYIDAEQEYTWFDGLSRCLKMNMNLVSIETEQKSEKINQLVMETFGRNIKLWVGGVMTHYHDGRQYIWTHTGQPFTYSFWSGANPDFETNSEYCVQIGWGYNMEWNDKSCDSRLGYICELPQQENAESKPLMNKLGEIQQLINEDAERKNIWLNEAEDQQYKIQYELQNLKVQLQQLEKENLVKKEELLEKSLQTEIKLKQILQMKLKNPQEQQEFWSGLQQLREKYLKKRIRSSQLFFY
ncbi:lectin subunit alpha-like [Lucilia sericata]|uniref:lectin subunit alpha-like n=1 Tax=Lucilia sericata TaxID=13632 RepID=UPI0018A7F35C|nr:lectin subunit alpha-like [Lucilia sericata]